MKQIEHDINQQVDIKELKRIGSQYSISEKCTRIYETFVKAVGMEAAKVYAIQGKRGEVRFILA